MKFNTKDILSNQWVLYIVAFLSLTSVFGYLMNNDYAPILFFILVAFLTNYFSKNMIIILGIALIATNMLASISTIFGPKNVKEGLENAGTKECETNSTPETCKESENCSWDTETKQCGPYTPADVHSKSAFTNLNVSNPDDAEKKMDNLESLYDSETIRHMTNETQSLMKEQEGLMQQMKDLGPLVNQAMGALQNLGSGNMVDMFSSLSGSLSTFKDKYPEAFPDNFDEKTAQISDLIAQAKELNAQKKRELAN